MVTARKSPRWFLVAGLAALLLTGRASMNASNRRRLVASMLGFLFPSRNEPPVAAATEVAVIKVPFRLSVAFVPDNSDHEFRLAETDRLRLAGLVRDAFANYPLVQCIEAVPSLHLEPGGGFDNLDRIAALLRLDMIALIS